LKIGGSLPHRQLGNAPGDFFERGATFKKLARIDRFGAT